MRSRRPARRSWLLVGLGVVACAAAALAAYLALTRETAQPASVSQAVEQLRALPAAARELPPALRGRAPTPGVYRYTTGGSEVSHVLGTRRHAYPARTTVAVSTTAAGCLRTRWDVLATRFDAVLACRRPDGSWRLVSQSDEHEFAGHIDRRTYVCTPDSTYRPARLAPGTSWRSHCSIDGTTTADRSTVLGPRTFTLDGRRTRTVLLRTRTHVSGDTIGTGTTDTWILPRTGLIVRRAIDNASRTETIVGDVAYEEQATLALSSPRPLR
ncbi:MAG TPA: hypothetical protein VK506_00610 [Conexibacter sp.]|nr:hypothetical protein [Conexibacter sp.]